LASPREKEILQVERELQPLQAVEKGMAQGHFSSFGGSRV
jgi:hypothetical protein